MEFKRFTTKNIISVIIIISCYILGLLLFGEFRNDHAFLIILFLLGYYLNSKTRKFVLAFSIFIIYWIIYDCMRLVPNHTISEVHIKEPYILEKVLFGITSNNNTITPNEYFAIHNNALMDFFSGIFYLSWIPVPLVLGVYLFLRNKLLFAKFSVAFFIVNILGFILYYLYPAAPPWYVDIYGFKLVTDVPGNAAGLSRFDELTGLQIFSNMYNKNSNVLAAIPSLHASYLVITLYYGIKKGLKWASIVIAVFMIGIWFTAIYAGHHYIIDVILGVLLAVFTLILFENLLKFNKMSKLIKQFVSKI